MNGVVFQLAVVFTPGLIWATIVDALCVVEEKRTALRTSSRAFGFGLVSYLAYFTIYYVYFRCRWSVWPTVLSHLVAAPSLGDFQALRPKDVLFASILAIALSLGWSAAANRNLFHMLMRKLRITQKYGDESLWEFWFSQMGKKSEYVNFRDVERGITFAGFVKAYSGGGDVRELLLEAVRVFDSDSGAFLYEMPIVYLSRKSDVLHVEFPTAETSLPGAKVVSPVPPGQGKDVLPIAGLLNVQGPRTSSTLLRLSVTAHVC